MKIDLDAISPFIEDCTDKKVFVDKLKIYFLTREELGGGGGGFCHTPTPQLVMPLHILSLHLQDILFARYMKFYRAFLVIFGKYLYLFI